MGWVLPAVFLLGFLLISGALQFITLLYVGVSFNGCTKYVSSELIKSNIIGSMIFNSAIFFFYSIVIFLFVDWKNVNSMKKNFCIFVLILWLLFSIFGDVLSMLNCGIGEDEYYRQFAVGLYHLPVVISVILKIVLICWASYLIFWSRSPVKHNNVQPM